MACKRLYFVALRKPCFGENKNIIEMIARSKIDLFPPDIWKYYGKFITTKKKLRANSKNLLRVINETYNTRFIKLVIL